MDRLRIAVIGTRGFPNVQGGVERHCEELYTRLASLGCDIRVYARKSYVAPHITNYKGVEIYPLWVPRKKSLEAFIHTFFCIIHIAFRCRKFDIVHIHAIGPSLLTPLAKLLGMKVVVTNHGPDYDRQKWGRFAKLMLILGEYFGSRYASKVIAVSQHIKNTLTTKFKREIFYIPNGVTIQDKITAGSVIEKYGLKTRKYILAVGRFVPEKGFHDLFNAFKQINNVEWKLVVAGGADHEDDYSQLLKTKSKDDSRIVLTGFIAGKELSEIYSNAGLFVLPSYHEGLPITILEAMSYDIPVLVSDIPANKELVCVKKCTFPPGDINEMAKKMCEFIKTGIKDDIIKINRKRIRNEFNWDKIANDIYSILLTMQNRSKTISKPS